MIYLDNAATTRVDEDILKTYLRYQTEEYFNPSAAYNSAVSVKTQMERARKEILQCLKGNGQLIFTSGGTESDNLAMLGTRKQKGSRIIISAAEHPAVYNTASELRQRGFEVAEAPVNSNGAVDTEEFSKLLDDNTSLVSIMHVNNETGAVNDIKKLVEITKNFNKNILFHCDGVQAVGKVPVILSDLNVDSYAFSGHKIHAPKGVGGLFVKKGVNIRPIIFGGGQESGLRSSTENVGGIIAMAEAVRKTVEAQRENSEKWSFLKTKLAENLNRKDILILSDEFCSPSVFTFSMKSVRGEVMARVLESDGIVVGTGSACSSQKSVKRVPQAMNVPHEYLDGIIRLSFSAETTENDIDYFINKFNLEYSKLEKYGR